MRRISTRGTCFAGDGRVFEALQGVVSRVGPFDDEENGTSPDDAQGQYNQNLRRKAGLDDGGFLAVFVDGCFDAVP